MRAVFPDQNGVNQRRRPIAARAREEPDRTAAIENEDYTLSQPDSVAVAARTLLDARARTAAAPS